MDNELYPLSYTFVNCSYYYKVVSQAAAAAFRARTAWIDPTTGELTGKGSLNEYFDGEEKEQPTEDDMLIEEPPPGVRVSAASSSRVKVEASYAMMSSRSSSPLTEVASSDGACRSTRETYRMG